MTRISIFYPKKDEGNFDFSYYLEVHIPMSIQLQGTLLKETTIEKGVTGVPKGIPAPYVAICHFTYGSFEQFLEAFLPHQKTLTDDIPNYTNIEPVIQISEIVY